jgi:nucleotide-binding universal stress UspA family protein
MKQLTNILCGTDFSDGSREAGRVAAAWGACFGAHVQLVHVIDDLGAEQDFDGSDTARYDRHRITLQGEAEALSREFDVAVTPVLIAGIPEELLLSTARTTRSGLIVVSSLGRRKLHRWLLGSVAERVAQLSVMPVLVVRDSTPLIAWASSKRALRIVAGVDFGTPSRAAMRWLGEMRGCAPCDVQVTRVVSPPQEYARLGLSPAAPIDALPPNVERLLQRELRRWIGPVEGKGDLSWCLRVGTGRVESDLAREAERVAADLVVIGVGRRTRTPRRWQGSVSRGVLHIAEGNILTVPPGSSDSAAVAKFERVLVCTDFSDAANRAIPIAYGLVPTGGVVHLLHVVDTAEDVTPHIHERLHALIPSDADERKITSVVEVSPSESVHLAILQLANRRGVDAICMTTHGRTALSQVLLGSNAQEVIRRAHQAVVLVPPALT